MTGKPRATYDKEADAIGIYFSEDGAEYADSQEIAPGVVLDFDRTGRVIGVELLYVSKLLETGSTEAGNGTAADGKPAAADA